MDIEIARLHNEVSRRGLNGDSRTDADVRNALLFVFFFLFFSLFFFSSTFAASMRSAVGAGSNKRTVGGFSFCSLSILVRRIAVSLLFLFSLLFFLSRRRRGGGSERSAFAVECYSLERSEVPRPTMSFFFYSDSPKRAVATQL